MKRVFTLALGVASLTMAASPWSSNDELGLHTTLPEANFQSDIFTSQNSKTTQDPHNFIKIEREEFTLGDKNSSKVLSQRIITHEADRPEGTFEVICKMIYDETLYQPLDVLTAYNAETIQEGEWDYESDSINLYLTPGTYDFLMVFSQPSTESYFGEMGKVFVILENIEVNQDLTLNFEPATAERILKFNPTLRNGDPVSISTINIDENWNIEVLDKGNSDGLYIFKNIIVDGVGVVYSLRTNTTMNIESDSFGMWNTDWTQNWYLTPVSDRYQFINYTLIDTKSNTLEVCLLSCHGVNHPGVITNDPSLFGPEIIAEFELAPLSADSPVVSENPYGFGFGLYYDESNMKGYRNISFPRDYAQHVYYCPSQEEINGVHPLIQFFQNEYTEIINGYMEMNISTTSPE